MCNYKTNVLDTFGVLVTSGRMNAFESVTWIIVLKTYAKKIEWFLIRLN